MDTTNMRPAPMQNEIFRHFKGHVYPIVCTAINISDTDEPLVTYHTPDGKYFARPLNMFLSDVDREKYPNAEQKERFENVTARINVDVDTKAAVNCHASDVNDDTFGTALPRPYQIYRCIDDRLATNGAILINVLCVATHTETAAAYVMFSCMTQTLCVTIDEFMTKLVDGKKAYELVE